jgi:hypothetical protein
VRRHLLVGHAPHDVRPALTHAIEFQRLSWQARGALRRAPGAL